MVTREADDPPPKTKMVAWKEKTQEMQIKKLKKKKKKKKKKTTNRRDTVFIWITRMAKSQSVDTCTDA